MKPKASAKSPNFKVRVIASPSSRNCQSVSPFRAALISVSVSRSTMAFGSIMLGETGPLA